MTYVLVIKAERAAVIVASPMTWVRYPAASQTPSQDPSLRQSRDRPDAPPVDRPEDDPGQREPDRHQLDGMDDLGGFAQEREGGAPDRRDGSTRRVGAAHERVLEVESDAELGSERVFMS
jgi:hypothetical protein